MIEPVKTRSRVEEASPPPAAPRDGLFDRFRRLPFAEKLLGVSALAVAFGWLVSAQWSNLLQLGTLGGWFSTFCLIGTLGVIALTGARLFDLPWLSPAATTRLLIVAAFLPALGIAVELLSNFWFAVTVVGSAVMAWAAGRISLRDGLLVRRR
mgnify:CR=1 FL=1